MRRAFRAAPGGSFITILEYVRYCGPAKDSQNEISKQKSIRRRHAIPRRCRQLSLCVCH